VKLSAAIVEQTSCPAGKKRLDLFDEITTGFVCEITSNRKVYFLRYFDRSGRQRQMKLGSVGEISFDQARKAAKRLRSEVVLGGDPLAAKQEKKAIPTYASLAEQHIAHAKASQRSWWSVSGIITKHLLPKWSRMRLDAIASQEISLWLAEKAAEGLKPATVEKIRVVFGRSFELGRQWCIPGCDNNPVRAVPRRRFSNARERYLTASEAGRLRVAVEASLNPQLKHIVWLLLLTGARVSELLQAEWRHVDLERRAWLIPTSKTGKPRHVPLSQAAIDIIEMLPRFDGCAFVAPNPETKLPFVTLKRAWQTARREARLGDLRIHDLRHSAASFMINAGIDLYAVGKVLGHADHKSTMRYSHLANETLLAAVEAGAARLGGSSQT